MSYNIITYDTAKEREEMIKVFNLPNGLPFFITNNDIYCLVKEPTIIKELAKVLGASLVSYIIKEVDNTSLITAKVEYIRKVLKFQDLRELLKDDNYVYIGRGRVILLPDENGNKRRFPESDSLWANPYKVDKDGTLDEVIAKYAKYITKKLKDGYISEEELRKLKNKTLVCWCVDKRTKYNPKDKCICHGQVLMRLINELS